MSQSLVFKLLELNILEFKELLEFKKSKWKSSELFWFSRKELKQCLQEKIEAKEMQSDGMEIWKVDHILAMHDNLTAITTNVHGMDLYCILNNSQGHLQEKPMGSENAKNPY